MKRLGLIMALGAMLAFAPLVTACHTLEAAAAGAAVSVTRATPQQQNAVAAAGDAYVLVARAVTVYVQVANPPQSTKDRIKVLNDGAYAVLMDARAAIRRDDSPAAALALKAWESRFGDFKGFLRTLGVPLPTGT